MKNSILCTSARNWNNRARELYRLERRGGIAGEAREYLILDDAGQEVNSGYIATDGIDFVLDSNRALAIKRMQTKTWR